MNEKIKRFLDERGKIKQYPAKQAMRKLICAYLAEKFVVGVEYKEKEVNEIIQSWHTFGDYFRLRRDLIDFGLMNRLPDGSRYWKEGE